MLLVSPTYAERFPDFLRALNEGHTSADSLRLVYNKTPAQVQDDLRDYLDRQHLPLIQLALKKLYAVSASSVAEISSAEMDVTLGDLTPNNAKTQAALEGRLTSASSQLPGRADAEESLGYLALGQGKEAEARTHFQLAVDRHSTDANVFFYLAHLEHEGGAPASQVIPLLTQALSLKADLTDARLELALLAAQDGKFAQALEALQKLAAPRPENAYAAIYTEAYCYAHLEKFSEAKEAAQRAGAIATKDRERAQVAELLSFVDQQSR